ncbi:MAG: 4Fe-4S binding protein [Candidatus Thermoplasmatota archaeon]|nr:4Fe-4S binding protein [Candidatus Thermoplasmatota archaeon]
MPFENIPKVVGMVYAVVALAILVYLFLSNRFNRKIGYVFLVISSIVGFLVFAPMFPHQFQLLVLRDTDSLGAPIPMVLVGLLLFIAVTFVFGRLFCGYICPIGAVQELIYLLPVKKFKIKNKAIPIVFRGVFTAGLIISGLLFSIGILRYTGVSDFFNLNVSSIFFYIFPILLLISIFVYRPFCRFLCPYGVFLSLASSIGIFKLRRNDRCIECGKCETACPTNEAGRDDLKQECYMCNRCRDVCPVSAVEYRRKK